MIKKESKLYKILTKYPAQIIIILSILISLVIIKDYGKSWDEEAQRAIGLKSLNYAIFGNKSLFEYRDKDYGSIYEMVLGVAEVVTGANDFRQLMFVRHMVSHMFFLVGVYFFYRLVLLLYRNKMLAVFAMLMLLISPRIYAHSYFNTKDLPFMTMFIICFYSLAVAFQKRKLKNFIFLAIFVALLIDMRLMGVVMVPIILAFFVIDFVIIRMKLVEDVMQRNILIGIVVFSVSLVLFVIAFWPFLWETPFQHFQEAFQNMSKFRWGNDVLYLGDQIPATEVRWYFIPIWIFVSTPFLYLLLFITGLVVFVMNIIKKPGSVFIDNIERNISIYTAVFFGSLFTVIVNKAVLYDDWRQMYYLYPALLLIAMYGMHFFIIHKKEMVRKVTQFLIPAYFAIILIIMIVIHPFQQVYFNEITPKGDEYLRKNFEMDYWGLSYYQALDYILTNDDDKELKERFEDKLKKVSFSEGIILIKLIDRETGDTSFELIRDLKGSVSAYMWQGVARIFGSNLKLDYDPEGDDELIEDIVLRIERGLI
jgi:hypothetical protein